MDSGYRKPSVARGLASSVFAVFAIATVASAQDMIAGSVYIKFVPTVTTQGTTAPKSASRQAYMDTLSAKYGVTAAQPVFARTVSITTAGKTATIAPTTWVDSIKSRFPNRTRRIPPGMPDPPDLSGWTELTIDPTANPASVCNDYLKDHNNVKACTPRYQATAYGLSWTPNDPFFSSRGSFGQSYPDQWGPRQMRVQRAWGATRGIDTTGKRMVVAVVDTGVDYTHPDIADNIWMNPGEIPGNGIDDEPNGFVDDNRGWNFVDNNNDPMDNNGHGTHVAGIIGAVANNRIGMAGVAPDVLIMPVRALNQKGSGDFADLANAIVYAAANGADVISNSWGCQTPCRSNPLIVEAKNFAQAVGAIVVFAAGNGGDDVYNYSPQNDNDPYFKPVVVAANDPRYKAAQWGPTGSGGTAFGQTVDISAPGGGLWSDISKFQLPVRNILSLLTSLWDPSFLFDPQHMVVAPGYVRDAGTSMAAPHISGLAALILACNPGWNTLQVRYAVQASGKFPKVSSAQIGFGPARADVGLEFTNMPEQVVSDPSPDALIPITQGTVPINGTVFGGTAWSVRVGDGTTPIERNFRTLGSGSGFASGALANWSLSNESLGPKTIVLETVARIRADNSFTCGDTRTATTLWARRMRTARYVTVAPPITALSADANYAYGDPTISGDWVAATEWPMVPAEDLASRVVWVKNRFGGAPQRIGAAGSGFPRFDKNDPSQLVYLGSDAQIHYHNLQSGVDMPLTNSPGQKRYPQVNGDIAGWVDTGAGDADRIVMENIAAGVPVPIWAGSPGTLEHLTMRDNAALWNIKDEAGLYMYDIFSARVETIATAKPVLCGSFDQNWVVWWEHEGDRVIGCIFTTCVTVPTGNIYALNRTTGERRTLSRQTGYHAWGMNSCPSIDSGVTTWTENLLGPSVLFTFNLNQAGSTVRQLTFGETAASVQPDTSGFKLAFVDSIEQPNQVYLIDLASF